MNQKTVSLVTTRKRLLILLLSITFLFCALTVRLAYLQLISGSELRTKASSQWYRDLPLKAPRGNITDRSGNVLADNKDVFSVYIRPKAVTDPIAVSNELGSALGLDKNRLLSKITSSNVSEITVKRAVDPAVIEPLRQKNLTGVYYTTDSKRNYPASNYLANILGFTNVDNEGQSGLEGYYDALLKGVDGFAYTATDIKGNELEDNVTRYVPAVQGCDLTLSVDLNIQAFAETAVASAQSDHNALSANMIVMDVKTGGILAMASSPGFDLNEPPRNDLALLNALSKNSMIVDVYEPGSTFKIFTTAAALEAGAVSDSDTFFCGGSRLVDGQKIKCWRSIGHGSQHLTEGVKNSCNCVFMDLALRLGTDRLYGSLGDFGFGKKTDVDFFGESKGLLMNRAYVKTVDLARIGFGQAVAVTPLQLITGVCAAVNGGSLYKPYFLQTATDYSGRTVFDRTVQTAASPISAQTSQKLREMLEKVVSEGGGKKAQVPGYRIGGKTGTAQKYENGHIAQGKYISSFAGFAPVEDPRYAVLMIVNEPNSYAYYGSIVAAPYAGEVFAKIFDYTGLKPSVSAESVGSVNMPDLIGRSAAECAEALKSLGLTFEIAGSDGKCTGVVPAPGTQVSLDDVVLVRLSDEGTEYVE